MKYKKTLATLLFSFMGLTSLSSQVVIGTKKSPLGGALLELTEGDVTTKGLGLPRVSLSTLESLEPCATDTEGNKKDLIGLVVYNVSEMAPKPNDACDPFPELNPRLYPSLAVWDGEEWVMLEEKVIDYDKPTWLHPKVKMMKDVEGNVYTYRKFGSAGTWMTMNLRSKTYSPNTRGYDPNHKTLELNGNCGMEGTTGVQILDRYYSYPSPPYEEKENEKEEVYPNPTDPTMFNKMPNLGLRYNWGAATNQIVPSFEGEKIQGICPDGWYVPWVKEYLTLIAEISSNKAEYALEEATVAPERWLLTPCLPYVPANHQNGGSKMAADGGMSLLWNGSNSLGRQKEYGKLSCQIALNFDATVKDKKYGNFYIRNLESSHSWLIGAAETGFQYNIRCKKIVDDPD